VISQKFTLLTNGGSLGGNGNELGKLDDLIARSTDYLKEYPNNVNALYFGAKALVVRKQYKEAKERVDRLSEIEPSLKETVKEILEEINNAESS